MKPLNIDFRPRFPWRAAGMWVSCAALTITAACLGWASWQVRVETEQLSRENAQLEAKVSQLKARRQTELLPQPYLEAIADMVAISQFPLDSALRVLESIDVPGVRVTSLTVDALEGSGTAVVEASSAEALKLFLERLAAQETRPRWELQSASSVKRAIGERTDSAAPKSIVSDSVGNELPVSMRADLVWR